jgi:hypothetical protein
MASGYRPTLYLELYADRRLPESLPDWLEAGAYTHEF